MARSEGWWDCTKILAPLSLILFTAWHVFVMHHETLPGVDCPPSIKCDFEEDAPIAIAPAISGQLRGVRQGLINSSASHKLPAYDVIALVMATASPHDTKLMDAADKTWLKFSSPTMTFTYFYALCHDEPAVQCSSGQPGCIRDRPHVKVIPCKHGYKFLTSKSIEGYRYIVQNFDFKYVIKVDVDSLIDLPCLETSIQQIPKKCTSFGMGLWRAAMDSKVFKDGNGKYDNSAFSRDTGADGYPPYMTGWAMLWSADVVRFLGMAGLSGMPKWRQTWTIDDAAIGTFVLGLDLCRLPMTCPVWTEQSGPQIEQIWDQLHKGNALDVGYGGKIEGFRGPFDDDVPNLGDLYNLQAKSLGHCASMCASNRQCRSFEFSSTAGERHSDPIKNCQIASGTQRAGQKWRDFVLYLKD